MVNQGKGYDESRYFALEASVTSTPKARAKVLKRLVRAVETEEEIRSACRDLDVEAATRVRAWWA